MMNWILLRIISLRFENFTFITHETTTTTQWQFESTELLNYVDGSIYKFILFAFISNYDCTAVQEWLLTYLQRINY